MQLKKSGFTTSIPLALLAAWLMLFALPASAANKTIMLQVTPTTLTSATTTVTAKITNSGNSNANSFAVDWTTSPNFTVTGATAGSAIGTCSTTGFQPGYSTCVFNKTLPTKTFVTITLTVQVTNACTALSINWLAYAWAGSPGPLSQTFTLQGPPNTTASTPDCEIKFDPQPKNAFIGSTITGVPFTSLGSPVRVQLVRSGAAPAPTTVSLSANPPTCATTTAASVTTDSSGFADVEFTGAGSGGTCQLTATATGFGSATSQSFQVVQPGQLGCAASNNTFGTTGLNGLVLSATRLENVDDPSPTAVGGAEAPDCEVVPYVISTTCPVGVTGTCTNFTYDPLHQGSHMAFAFHWVWPLEGIPTGGIEGVANTEQFFLNGSTLPLELDLCEEITPLYDSNGVLIGLAPTSGPPDDYDNSVDGTQAGCLVRRLVKQIGTQIQLTEDAYVQGDYAARRN